MLLIPPPHQHSNCYSRKITSSLCSQSCGCKCPRNDTKCYLHLLAAGGTVPGWKAAGESCVSKMPFRNISFFFWPREKELAELKQQVDTLKSSIAKEEERVADLKLKVHLFSSGECEADDQVHPEIKARRVSVCVNGSSLPAVPIPGRKSSGSHWGGTSRVSRQWSYSKGRFGALLRQQTAANVPAPCRCYEVGGGLAEATGQLQPVPGHSKAGKVRPTEERPSTAICPRHWG